MSVIQIINPLDFPQWNELILKFNNYSFFHTKEWANVLVKSYGYRPAYFTIFSDNKISAVIPSFIVKSFLTGNRLVSLPFSDFCEPLFSSLSESEALSNFIFAFSNTSKFRYSEFRSSNSKYPNHTQSCRTDLRHLLYFNSSEEELFKTFSENNKRNIKKALKQNVKVDLYNSTEGLNAFYDMFCVTRKKHGLPPQPFSFFRNIFDLIIQPGIGDIILAKHGGKYIAGAIYFKFGKKILYKFGASYPEHNDLRGNNAVMWFAIQKYLSERYNEFDFGRTELNHDSLRRYKLSWATEESLIFTTRISNSMLDISLKTNGNHNLLFNRTPIFFLRIFGRIFYKHMA